MAAATPVLIPTTTAEVWLESPSSFLSKGLGFGCTVVLGSELYGVGDDLYGVEDDLYGVGDELYLVGETECNCWGVDMVMIDV